MYFERQEPGSQLCAQHCLNNILQQFTYSEFDLADIAHKLDQAENAALSVANQNKKSYNLDDTGYFSISVLERALEVWDLTLVRWRGEAMKRYQEHPEEQAAFILNLASHWLPLRRFAPNPPHASATKRWYNLNSFLPAPEWISPTYLRLVLSQAEEEGYSVFVVRRATPGTAQGEHSGEGQGWEDGGIGALPECLADTMAVELGEPVGRQGSAKSGGVGGVTTGGSAPDVRASHTTSVNPDTPTVDMPSSSQAGPSSPPARRRKRQQDLAPSDPAVAALIGADEYFKPPITRTRQSSNKSTPKLAPTAAPDIFDDQSFPLQGNDDDDEEIVEDEADPLDDDEYPSLSARGREVHPTDFQFQSRSYDDEDEALQAALKASMMDVPAGWVAPELKETKLPSPAVKSPPAAAQAAPSASLPGAKDPSDDAIKEVEDEDDDDDKPAEAISPDEIRRRRLAKFGL
ncbi:hypothetical protein IAU60_004780 [Kwoniella sp. DSM 27419]